MQPLKNDKLLELMNMLLKKQKTYVVGMVFVPVPIGEMPSNSSGYNSTTDYGSNVAYANAARLAREMHDLDARQ